jgi:tRNA (guanine37-N1)-methyltransferase
MFEFRVVTIFPELFSGFVDTSLIGRAKRAGLLSIDFMNLRDHTHDRHRTVDDAPYGGGAGLVMKPEPIFEVMDALSPCHKVLLTPQGCPFSQAAAIRLAEESSVMLFCGRYEGIDERVIGEFDEEISIGDFVLNGGEVAAMTVIEAVSRLLPGVLGNAASTVEESFSAGTLEYPQYTRPEVFRGQSVPGVLLSGDHGKIARWRRKEALLRTRARRPDLFYKLLLSDDDQKLLVEAEQKKDEETKVG